MDFEIFKKKALEISWQDNFIKFSKNKDKFNRTFINPTDYFLEPKEFKNKVLTNNKNLSHIRLTLDYQEDFKLIEEIYKNLYCKNKHFGLPEILNFLNQNPNLCNLNKKHIFLD